MTTCDPRGLRGDARAVEARIESALAHARASQARLGAFVTLTPELARAAARAIDCRRADPAHVTLAGRPIGIKDLIDVAGVPTRLGTPGAGHRVPAGDASVVEATTVAGFVPIGKTATHELGLGMVTPQTRNPFDTARIAGGSSGGSAAAVAAGLVTGALGTDTAGSTRCPAALCGVVGLKPSYGALSTTGVAPLAPTHDTVGVLGATVAVCRELYLAAGGLVTTKARPPRPWRLGVDTEQCSRRVTVAVRDAFFTVLADLAEAGVELVDVRLPEARLFGACSMVVVLSEASAAWRRLESRTPRSLGSATRAALEAGAQIRATSYLRARAVETDLRAQIRELMECRHLDVLATPTAPITAVPVGVQTVSIDGHQEALEAAHARFTVLASVTGQPAVSVPCGMDENGLPIGLQLIGRHERDLDLLSLAEAVESLRGCRLVADRRAHLRFA